MNVYWVNVCVKIEQRFRVIGVDLQSSILYFQLCIFFRTGARLQFCQPAKVFDSFCSVDGRFRMGYNVLRLNTDLESASQT